MNAIDKVLELINDSIKAIESESVGKGAKLKASQLIKIDGEGTAPITIGEINMTINASIITVSQNLIKMRTELTKIQDDNSIFLGENGMVDYNRDRLINRLYNMAIEETGGNKAAAGRLLGITDRTLRGDRWSKRINVKRIKSVVAN